jgi:hypothetical protein
MMRFTITTVSGKTISGVAESADKIEQSILLPELSDPEVVEAINAKYGTPEQRQQRAAALTNAYQSLTARNFNQVETELQAIIAANPPAVQLALARNLLEVARALKELAIIVRREIID